MKTQKILYYILGGLFGIFVISIARNQGEVAGYDKATKAFNDMQAHRDSAIAEEAYQRGLMTGRSIERSSRMH